MKKKKWIELYWCIFTIVIVILVGIYEGIGFAIIAWGFSWIIFFEADKYEERRERILHGTQEERRLRKNDKG